MRKQNKLNYEIKLLKQIIKWQKKYFDFSKDILSAYFETEKELFNVWGDEFLGKNSMNVGAVGIWVESQDKKGILNSKVFKIREGVNIERKREATITKDDPVGKWFLDNDSNSLLIITPEEGQHFTKHTDANLLPPDGKVHHLMFLKITYGGSCIGIMDFYNQYRRHREGKDMLSPKGFSWLAPSEIEDGQETVEDLFSSIGSVIGETIARFRQSERLEHYITDFIQKHPVNMKDIYQLIKTHLIELADVELLSLWKYDDSEKVLVLSYLYGDVEEDPSETIQIENSWLSDVVSGKEMLKLSLKPSRELNYPQSWIKTFGDYPIIAVPLLSKEAKVYAVVSLHFTKADSLKTELLEKVALYFRMCSSIIESEEMRYQRRREENFKQTLWDWLDTEAIDKFYEKLVEGVSKIMENSSCSIFMRSRIENHRLKLEATTSNDIKRNIGKAIYNLNNPDVVEDFGITGKIMTDELYSPLIYRVKNNPYYSGGSCDEIEGYGLVSVVYGRIRQGKQIEGVIRCVVLNQLEKIGNNERIYRTFDKSDMNLINHIAALCGIIIRILNYSAIEKQRLQELQHETITPISIIKIQSEDLTWDIIDHMKLNSKEMFPLIDSQSHKDLDRPVWSENTLSKFNLWLYKLRLIEIEAEMAANFIRTANAIDVPFEKYKFEDRLISSILTPLFHHAVYLGSLKNLEIGRFKDIIEEAKRHRFTLFIDPFMFNTAFLHIIDNAIKYCNKNVNNKTDNIWFEMFIEKINEIKVFRLIIWNTGMPPPENERDIIFDKYRSGKKAKLEHKAGKGIGLYVARLVLKNHGGKLLLCDDTVPHTAFEIRMPLSKRR